MAHFSHCDIGPEMVRCIPYVAIRGHKEDRFVRQRLVRDFRKTLGESLPIRRQSGRPSFWTLIEDADASIVAHFRRYDIGPEMAPEMGYPYPRLGGRKRTPSISNNWPAIPGRSWGNSGQSTANPGDPLSGL